MADVFISYSKRYAGPTEDLAAELIREGISVWWDTELLPAQSYRDVIVSELAKAKAVVVIWTAASATSDWVYSEANRAHSAGKLIQVRAADLDPTAVPPPFDALHMPPLEDRRSIYSALARLGVEKQALPPPTPAAGSAEAMASAIELERWSAIKATEDPQRLRDFITRFPRGEFADLALERLAHLEFARLAPSPDADALRSFATAFDKTEAGGTAAVLLAKVEAEAAVAAWNAMPDRRDPKLVEAFLLNHPQTANRVELEKLLSAWAVETAAFQTALEQGTSRALRQFLLDHPNARPQIAADARATIGTKEREEHEAAWMVAVAASTVEGFREYLAAFPKGTYARDARAHLARLGEKQSVSAPVLAAIAAVVVVAAGAAGWYLLPADGSQDASVAANPPQPAATQSQPRFSLKERLSVRVASMGQAGDARFDVPLSLLKRSLSTASRGAIELQSYFAGQLMPAFQTLEGVRDGFVDVGWVTPSLGTTSLSMAVYGTNWPFAISPAAFVTWIEGAGGRQLAELRRAHPQSNGRLVSIPCALLPPGADWFKRNVNGPNDLRGLTITAFSQHAAVLRRVGAVPQLLPAGEITLAMQKGVVSAAAGIPFSIANQMRLTEVARNAYYPSPLSSVGLIELVVNSEGEFWKKLGSEGQVATREICALILRQSLTRLALPEKVGDQFVPNPKDSAMITAVQNGTQVTAYPVDVVARLKTAHDAEIAAAKAKDGAFSSLMSSYEMAR